MGKKRRTEDEPAAPASAAAKKQKGAGALAGLSLAELEEKEASLAEEVRVARRSLGAVRGSDPGQNRISWQREVTKHNNAVHKLELTHSEVKREVEKRKAAGEAGGSAATAATTTAPSTGPPLPAVIPQIAVPSTGLALGAPDVTPARQAQLVVPPPPPVMMSVLPTWPASAPNQALAAVAAAAGAQAVAPAVVPPLQPHLPLAGAAAAWGFPR
mmetsp:Transcript_13155/g.30741  ORF Transcript_13155/g.30741 Transcript_13155/m.30741 type:complete len:214 (-) Transcript_13155:109-750(-)